MSAVKVGQIWRDNDVRGPLRFLRIKSVGELKAEVEVNWDKGNKWYSNRPILLSRFRDNSTGYKLIRDPEAGA